MIVIVLTVLAGGYYTYKTKTSVVTVVNNEPTVVEKTVEVETVDKQIEAALKAAEVEIEQKAKDAYTTTRNNEESKIRTKVRDAYIAELKLINESEKKEQIEY